MPDEAQLPDRQQLADVLSDFASTMLTNFPIQSILDRLVERIVRILPISSAGVTLIAPGADPRYIAASDDAALRYEQLQSELDEGPCVLAYQSGQAVTVPDLRAEERFPRFIPRAIDEGLAAVFTFPLRHGDSRLGALDLYRQEPGQLSEKCLSTAQTLADVVSAYMLNAQTREDLQDSSDRAREAALHDGLTGLPNRALMLERMEHALVRNRRSGKATVVLFVDLDHFKAVNDTHGHRIGDELLIAVARRLASALRAADTVARWSGDEFVVMCEDLDGSAGASAIGRRLVAALTPPFRLSNTADPITVTASIGIAVTDRSRADLGPKQLIHEADTAMYTAKRAGGRQVFQLPQSADPEPAALGRGHLQLSRRGSDAAE